MGSGSSSQSIQRSGPWRGQQPYLRQQLQGAQNLYGQDNYNFFPGQSVAGFSDPSQRAFGMTEQLARQGDAATTAGRAETTRTLQGDYLNPESNSFLSRFAEIGARNIGRGFRSTINALGSRMEASGRSGGGTAAHGYNRAEENLATGLGDFNAQLMGGAYNPERDRMMASAGLAPSYQQAGFQNTSALRAVGAQQEEQSQREIDDLMARFDKAQYGSAEKLAEFQGMIGQPLQESYGTSSSTQVGIFS